MCLSIFLAQVIGLYLFIMGLVMLIYHHRFKKAMADLNSSLALVTFTGMMILVVGLLIVIDHNIWVPDWPLLITIIGWILILQGLVRLFVPDAFVRMAKDLQNKVIYTLMCWVRLLVGVYLIWAGFSQV